MRKLITMVLVIVLVILTHVTTFAYDDKITHRDLTNYAVKNSTLKSYLSQNLGQAFAKNYESSINGNQVIEWIKQGAIDEDAVLCRRASHFHNPLLPWDQSYMSDVSWTDYTCTVKYSAVTLATRYLSPPPTGQKTDVHPWYQTWDYARTNYYDALTSIDNAVRSNAFEYTFVALGHVLHLLQDMGVPAHTRNDFASHLINGRKQPYEYYVRDNDLVTEITVAPSFANTKLTDFWDAELYNGSNPSTLMDIGLAEFSNANYFSDFTIPNNGTTPAHSFPYPHIGSANVSGPNYQVCSYQFLGGVATVNYVSRTNKGPCPSTPAAADHFAVASLMNLPGVSDINSISRVWFTSEVHAQYASELLPRAVGYSAALLNYFFRGQLGVSLVPDGMKVKNLSEEAMSSGTIEVFYDDTNKGRHPLQTYNMANSLAPGQTTPVISFTIPVNPPNVKVSRYIVVFKGKLGNEVDAVIGNVYSPTLYYFATVDGIDKIMRVNTAGGDPVVVADTDDPNVFLGRISPSPDGKVLVFVVHSPQDEFNGNIYKFDLATGTTTFLTTGNSPDMSPDGKKIVFSRELGRYGEWADEQIFTRNLVTNAETQLTNVPYSAQIEPVWSPDGSLIAYSRFNSGGTGCSNYYTVNVITSAGAGDGSVTCQTGGAVIDREPAWSPDGNELAFVRSLSGQSYSQLYKVNVATRQGAKLTDSNGVNFNELSPAWSPDGLTIAVGSTRTGDYDVWLVDPHGAGYLLNLTNANGTADGFPVFGK